MYRRLRTFAQAAYTPRVTTVRKRFTIQILKYSPAVPVKRNVCRRLPGSPLIKSAASIYFLELLNY
jgi:hypothetical protein